MEVVCLNVMLIITYRIVLVYNVIRLVQLVQHQAVIVNPVHLLVICIIINV